MEIITNSFAQSNRYPDLEVGIVLPNNELKSFVAYLHRVAETFCSNAYFTASITSVLDNYLTISLPGDGNVRVWADQIRFLRALLVNIPEPRFMEMKSLRLKLREDYDVDRPEFWIAAEQQLDVKNCRISSEGMSDLGLSGLSAGWHDVSIEPYLFPLLSSSIPLAVLQVELERHLIDIGKKLRPYIAAVSVGISLQWADNLEEYPLTKKETAIDG